MIFDFLTSCAVFATEKRSRCDRSAPLRDARIALNHSGACLRHSVLSRGRTTLRNHVYQNKLSRSDVCPSSARILFLHERADGALPSGAKDAIPHIRASARPRHAHVTMFTALRRIATHFASCTDHDLSLSLSPLSFFFLFFSFVFSLSSVRSLTPRMKKQR